MLGVIFIGLLGILSALLPYVQEISFLKYLKKNNFQ